MKSLATLRLHAALGLVLAGFVLAGCRGTISEKPPIHINPNMDFQERFEAQEANAFFADGRAMRPPVPGTVARGFLREDSRFYEGREADGTLVTVMPVPITRELVLRGRARYNIYCAPCHGLAGDGQGPISTGGYGMVPAPTFHTDYLRTVADGYFFDAITNGIRTMPSYAAQIPVADRWAITAYLRALQRSQHAAEGDVPQDVLTRLRQRP
ncbi:cytochrome c [Rhodocaloribacter litoris]|uniref:c-type cytochrome n=1 Tax=Rhodocaloribacter litoris TaxID=2558931 RepID=UPI00141DBB6F|nr:cytochrome c [Rhodocaloribacter litoris]QXD15963.1 cytochrome c [Rhodocaloribacter litoris]